MCAPLVDALVHVLLGQRRSADLDVEEQAITLLEHEGMKMR